MRAVRNTEQGITVVDVAEPRLDAGMTRVRVVATAICTSDLHLADAGMLHVTPGHEFAGLLDDGTAVAVRPQVPCGDCDQCVAGDGNLCRTAGERIYGVSLDGGMSPWFAAHPGTLFPLPGTLDARDAAVVEPLSVALHGVHRSGLASGMRVLVVGAGPIGLCAVTAARSTGADVDLAPARPQRTAAGERLGASVGVRGEYDVVLDAAGTQGSFDLAVRHLRPRGTLCVLGTYWTPVSMDYAMQCKEITLVPAYMYGHHHGTAEFGAAAQLLADTPELATALVTHRFPLQDAAQAFACVRDRAAGAIKVVLEP